MRRSTLIWTVLCVTVVIGLFVIKHEVQELEEKLQALNAEIITDQDAIQVLQAEWAYLNQPSRLEALSTKLLGMEPPTPAQTQTLSEFLELHRDDAEAGTQLVDGKPVPEPETKPRRTAVAATAPAKPAAVPHRPPVETASAPPTVPAAIPAKADDHDWLKPILAGLKQTR